MDICDLLRRDAKGHELVAYIIVDIEFTVTVRSGEVAENHLRGTRLLRALPYLKDILGAGGGLAGFVVGQHFVHQPLVERQLSAVVGNEQHIVHAGIHHLCPDALGALGKRGYHLLLLFGRL